MKETTTRIPGRQLQRALRIIDRCIVVPCPQVRIAANVPGPRIVRSHTNHRVVVFNCIIEFPLVNENVPAVQSCICQVRIERKGMAVIRKSLGLVLFSRICDTTIEEDASVVRN